MVVLASRSIRSTIAALKGRDRAGVRAALLIACAALGCCAGPTDADLAAAGPDTPGWTGRTLVPGSRSTIAGAANATYNQQKWQLGPNR